MSRIHGGCSPGSLVQRAETEIVSPFPPEGNGVHQLQIGPKEGSVCPACTFLCKNNTAQISSDSHIVGFTMQLSLIIFGYLQFF